MTTACFGDSIAVLLSGVLGADDRAVWGAPMSALPSQVGDAAPAVAVISAGVNDVLREGDIDCQPLAASVEALRQHGTHVVVLPATVAPWRRSRRIAERLATVNAAVDRVPIRLPLWGWQRDGIHPNRLGRFWLAREVTKARAGCPERTSRR